MLFFSPYRYRGQLYSIIYGQAIPSVIGQKSVALTVNVGLEDNYYKYIRYAHRNIEDIDKWTLILAKITLYAYSYICGFENNKETLYNALCKLIRTA